MNLVSDSRAAITEEEGDDDDDNGGTHQPTSACEKKGEERETLAR